MHSISQKMSSISHLLFQSNELPNLQNQPSLLPLIALQKELQVQSQSLNFSSDSILQWLASSAQSIQQDYQQVKQALLKIVDSKDHSTMNKHFLELKNIVRQEQDNNIVIGNTRPGGVKELEQKGVLLQTIDANITKVIDQLKVL